VPTHPEAVRVSNLSAATRLLYIVSLLFVNGNLRLWLFGSSWFFLLVASRRLRPIDPVKLWCRGCHNYATNLASSVVLPRPLKLSITLIRRLTIWPAVAAVPKTAE